MVILRDVPSHAGTTLLAIARHSIRRHFDRAVPSPEHEARDGDWLAAPGATFVTLKQDGELRGCVGTLEARRPLGEDVRSNAIASAFYDDRFPPLERDELDATRIEVSLLSGHEPLRAKSEEHAALLLRPGIDGVILSVGDRRGTFLPQVWEQLEDPTRFLRALKRKAGLPEAYWSGDLRLSRYEVAHWEEAR